MVRKTAPLGKNRDTPPAPRRHRYRPHIRQAAAQRLVAGYWSQHEINLRGSSVLGCGRWRVFGEDPHQAQIEVDNDGARLRGHFTCGCNWTCECCAATSVARNRGWLRGALFPALAQHGKSGSLVTLTLSHRYDDDWADVVATLKSAYARMDRRLHKVYKKAGSAGKFKAFEVTVGANGLHPHLHILITHDADTDTAALAQTMEAAWRQALTEVGGHCTQHGFDFQAHRLDDYAAKMGAAHELAAQSTKSGRRKGFTLSQLLDAASHGDLCAGAEWQRAIAALKATNRFHAGSLAQRLGIPTPSEWEEQPAEAAPPAQAELPLEQDDATGADTDQAAEPAPPAIISYPLVDHLKATHPALGRPGLAMILRAARRGGTTAVLRMVDALCRDSERKQYEALLAAPPIDSQIITIAAQRPLNKDEIAEYLRYKRQALRGQPPHAAAVA